MEADGHHEMLVLQMAKSQKMRKGLKEASSDIHQYPYILLFNKSYEETSPKQRFQRILHESRQYDPDVVILPGYVYPELWPLIPYWKSIGKKLIIAVDSTYYDHPKNPVKEAFKRFLLSFADLVYCYGSMQVDYLKYLNVSEQKIHIRCQATDNEKYIQASAVKQIQQSSSKSFLYVGRLSAEKNLLLLLEVFANLDTDWTLTIVGDGPQKEALLDYVEQAQLDRVRFTGGLSWDEVIDYYTQADVFILPSTSEPWGLVVNEAMLCKMPVIVSNHCGCSKDLITEHVNGFTFDPHDKNALQQHMQFFIDHPDRIVDMGSHSFEIIQAFNPNQSATQMLNGIKRLV